MSTIGKIADGIGEFNSATAKAQIAIAGIGMLVAGIRAIISNAKGSGVNMKSYEEALAGFDAAEKRVEAELAEYDEIKAAEAAKKASTDGKA